MFTDTEIFSALLRRSSEQTSPLFSYKTFQSFNTVALKHGCNPKCVLEVGTGASVGALFCFLANGSKRACGIDIAPISINPDDPFFKDLKLLLGAIGSGGWYHRQMGHPTIRNKLDLKDSWWDIDPVKLAASIEYFAPYDAGNLPFQDESFDLIYSGAVLEHIPRPEQALSEMRRVLKRGGLCIHGIDLRSHNDKGWLSLYTLSEDEHKSLSEEYTPGRGVKDIYSGKWTGQVFCNRLLAHQWKSLFDKFFSVLDYEEVARIKPNLVDPSKFTHPFSSFTSEQLAPLTISIVAQKDATP